MANVQKYSDMKDIGHLCKHYERSVEQGHYGNENIDQTRLNEDRFNFAPDRGKQTDYINEQIDKVMEGRTVRKDAVKMCCWIVDKPKNLPPEREGAFFKETYKFLIARYGAISGMGEDVCVSCYLHRSETTPHIHFAFMPVIERKGVKSLCAKEVISRQELKSFHEDLGAHLERLGVCKKTDILNGATIKNSNGRALSVKELKRKKYQRERERSSSADRWSTQTKKMERERRW